MNRVILVLISFVVILSSCSTDKVMTSHIIQKRKYRPGLYVSKSSEKDKTTSDISREQSKSINDYHAEHKANISLPKPHFLKIAGNKIQKLPILVDQENNEVESEHLLVQGFKSAMNIASKSFRVKCKPSQDYYEEQMQPRSSYGTSGFALGLAAIVLLVGAFSIQSFWAALLLLLALIVAVFGLIRSIKGLKDSYEFNRKGKVFSYIGLFASATALGISAFMVFIVLLALLAFVL